jgi:hypothetical protein
MKFHMFLLTFILYENIFHHNGRSLDFCANIQENYYIKIPIPLKLIQKKFIIDLYTTLNNKRQGIWYE